MKIINKTYAIWVLVIGAAIGGVIVLIISGQFFIGEIIQEVDVPDPTNITRVVALGEKAPLGELADTSGNMVRLAEYIGKPLALTFWVSWNPLAVDQIKVFDSYLLGEDTRKELFQIITINNQEDPSIVKNFIRRGGYQVFVLLDEDGAMGERYSIQTLPITYFINSEGIVQSVFTGVLSEKTFIDKIEELLR